MSSPPTDTEAVFSRAGQPGQFGGFRDAYACSLRDLRRFGRSVPSTADPNSVGSNFGASHRATKELIGYAFCLEQPWDRCPSSASRPLNLPFAVANCLWTLAGSNELAFINHYNPRGARFSDDGVTLGGAHGHRLRHARTGDGRELDQIAAVTARLRADPHSRRTVASIYHPQDSVDSSRDMPCPIALQFLQRDGRLDTVCFMRSQSAAMVMPYDVFAFTFIQEAVAVDLGLATGTYTHVAGSFHYYDEDLQTVLDVVAEADTGTTAAGGLPPQMPMHANPSQMLDRLLALDRALRAAGCPSAQWLDVELGDLPPYWRNLGLILAAAALECGGRIWTEIVERLPDYYRAHMRRPGH